MLPVKIIQVHTFADGFYIDSRIETELFNVSYRGLGKMWCYYYELDHVLFE